MTEVLPAQADIVWLVYDLELDKTENQYHLHLVHRVYTLFNSVLDQIATPEPGMVDEFLGYLQEKLDEKLEDGENPPDAPTLGDLL